MSKRRHAEEFEIPFVALMDTMTNVVGVLILVLVLMGLAVANAVKKILSELPPVTVEQLEELKQMIKSPPDPNKLEEQLKKLQEQLKKTEDELKTLDLTTEGKQLVDIDNINKQLEEKKKVRDLKKTEVTKLLAELDKIKAQLDQTPKVTVGPATEVRLPNPRPYPEKPVETRVLVAKEGVLFLNDVEFLRPIVTHMDQVRSQFEYKNPDPAPFMPMLEKIFKSKTEPQAAWPVISPLAGQYQMDAVANAYKTLKEGGLPPSAKMLEALGSISLVTRKPLPAVAAAVVAATKGDYSKWLGLDPTTDPAKPRIKVVPDGKSKVAFHFDSKVLEVRPDQRGILGYFAELSDTDSFKNASRNKVIYDAFKIADFIKRASASPAMGKAFTMAPQVKPGSTQAQIALSPRSGESVEKMRQPNSDYLLMLRRIKANPDGVALFQILPGAIQTYLEARAIADEVGVPATWEFRGDLNVVLNIPGFEVQRFQESAPPKPSTMLIAPPKKTRD